MSLGLWNLQWLNHNSQRSYPIADWATKKCSISDEIRIPDDFILAVNFAVSSAANVDIDKFYIKAIAIMPTGVSILIGYSGYEYTAAVTHIVTEGPDEIITAALTGVSDFDDTIGYIAINTKSSIFNLTPGYYTFSYNDTALEPDCIRPMLRAVTSLQVQTAGGYSDRMYGDIVLVAGSNIEIDVIERSPTRNVIRISALPNASYVKSCVAADNTDRQAVKAINGVPAAENGNITIQGADCVSVKSGTNTIVLRDTCAQPCCGCPELTALESQISRLDSGKATLDGFVSDILAGVTVIEGQVLGGK